ncbi:hypothetical protein ISF_10056 [Cordyceps fumosorosea ARSEF 2679]|uniref:Uncharacterized protein n=1 Tax=Cordyceps fumosorosea (strain ARSEF 2679) TaxID=1081104 RepID=A0A166VNU3_CORFA|nr:hypothetical protein ISF_10056 [Cordyceps fumosorosea ARSEF 2679]OAA33868.1 hypothetical protein ISF_10056 [Cordyceps fumosorosea ARSEF 2679]
MELQLSQIRFITGLHQNQIEAEDIFRIWQMSSKVCPGSPGINASAPLHAARYILGSKFHFVLSLSEDGFPVHRIVSILDVWQMAFAPNAGRITHDDVTFAIKLHSVGLTSREVASILWTRGLQKPIVTRVLSRTVRVSAFEFSEDVAYKLSQVGEVAHIKLENGIYHIQMKTHSQAAEAVKWGHSFAQDQCSFEEDSGVCLFSTRDLSGKDLQKLLDSAGGSRGATQLHQCVEEPDVQEKMESPRK